MLRTAIASAPRPSGGILRPTRSLGSLRSAAAAQQQQCTVIPPVPSRNLVSSVLLSREAYDRQNVNQLKSELKTRGLTSSGRRIELVTRLLNDDAKRSGSDLVLENVAAPEPRLRRGKASLASLRRKDGGKNSPQTPSNNVANKPSSVPSSTSKSSASAAPVGSSPKTEASFPSSHSGPIVGEGATIPHPPQIKPGDAVSPSLTIADGAVKAPEKLASAPGPPGVPPQKEPAHPETFKVFIPYEEPAETPGPEIPIVMMYTDRPTEPNRNDPTPAPIISPKLVRTDESTPVSHALEVEDVGLVDSDTTSKASTSLSSAAQSAKGDLSGQAGEILKKIDGIRSSASEATTSIVKGLKSVVASTGVEPSKVQQTISQTLSLDGTAHTMEDGKRPLNPEEKRGLYLLGGLIFGGYLAGGLGKPKKERKY